MLTQIMSSYFGRTHVFLPQRPEPTAKQGNSFRKVVPLPYGESILISPNPAKGEAYVHAWQNVQGGRLDIHSLGGERLEEFQLTHSFLNKVNLSNLRDGIYIVILYNKQGGRIGETKLMVVQ